MGHPLLKFEHQVLARLRTAGAGRRWLVAVSGGVDSMVLAEVTRRWRRKLCDRVVFAHVHHGTGPNRAYRDHAQDLVRRWARAHGLPFVTNVDPPAAPPDEAGLRRVRYGHLARWRTRFGLDEVVLAHHRDDLIETRLLRLIRGTGSVGLTAMRTRGGGRLRPLLDLSRAEIEAYARGRGLVWSEDPTNGDLDGLRAWVRHQWLPALEARRAGSARALARSLELLATPRTEAGGLARVASVRRDAWRELPESARAEVAREYVRALDARDFTSAHVRELVKRLDSERKEFSFKLCGFVFLVTRDHWWALASL